MAVLRSLSDMYYGVAVIFVILKKGLRHIAQTFSFFCCQIIDHVKWLYDDLCRKLKGDNEGYFSTACGWALICYANTHALSMRPAFLTNWLSPCGDSRR